MSSSDSEGEDWIPYGEREEWKDVEPIKQDDGPQPVVSIAYSDKCKYSFAIGRSACSQMVFADRKPPIQKNCTRMIASKGYITRMLSFPEKNISQCSVRVISLRDVYEEVRSAAQLLVIIFAVLQCTVTFIQL